VIMVDDDVHQNVKPAKLVQILERYRPDATANGNGVSPHGIPSGNGAHS
jgi:hypothetical protein